MTDKNTSATEDNSLSNAQEHLEQDVHELDDAGSGGDESAYIKRLRAEAKSRRIQVRQAEEKAQNAEAKAQQAIQRIDELQRANNERVIRAELKAQAALAGMIDMDGLKLADLSKVAIDDNGDVIGADELIKQLKESKPYLFKEVKNTSINPDTPNPSNSLSKKAMDMSSDEWKKDLAKYGIR